VQHIEAEREADYEANIGREKLEEIDGYLGKHLYVDAKHGKTTDNNHQLDPGQQNTQGGNVILPLMRWRNQYEAGCHDHAPLQPVFPTFSIIVNTMGNLENLFTREHAGKT